MMVCLLNRRPYRDREGNVRERPQSMCCGKKDACMLADQPDGQIIKRGGPKRKRKFKTAIVTVEKPKTKGKK